MTCAISGQLQQIERKIMRDASEIIRDRQLDIRRMMDDRGIHLKVVAFDSGIPYDTLISYFPGGKREPAQLPVSAAFALCGVLDDDLINLLCPQGYAVVPVPVDTDYDTINQHCMDFLSEKSAAHHPESEAGREIGPTERARIESKVVQLRGRVA
jgi:hypothetical protein